MGDGTSGSLSWSTHYNSGLGKFIIKFLILPHTVNTWKQQSNSHPLLPGIFTLKYLKFLYFETYKVPAVWSEWIITLQCSKKCTQKGSTCCALWGQHLHSSLRVNSPECSVTTTKWLNVLIGNSLCFFSPREGDRIAVYLKTENKMWRYIRI